MFLARMRNHIVLYRHVTRSNRDCLEYCAELWDIYSIYHAVSQWNTNSLIPCSYSTPRFYVSLSPKHKYSKHYIYMYVIKFKSHQIPFAHGFPFNHHLKAHIFKTQLTTVIQEGCWQKWKPSRLRRCWEMSTHMMPTPRACADQIGPWFPLGKGRIYGKFHGKVGKIVIELCTGIYICVCVYKTTQMIKRQF